MKQLTGHRHAAAKATVGICVAAALALGEGAVDWQEAGGTLAVNPGLVGIVGQGYATPALDAGATAVQGGFLAHPYLVNNAPFVVSGLADREEPMGFAVVTVDLDSVFADFEGALSYGVESTGPGTQASVLVHLLRLVGEAGATGTARVVVTATDGTYGVSDTFSVRTQGVTGISGRKAAPAAAPGLGVAVPKVFAAQASGSGTGMLGSSSAADEEQSLSVEVLLPAAGTISVHVFDQLGTPVIALERRVDAGELLRLAPAGDGRRVLPVTWNLRASNGAAVGAGVYLWKIEVRTDDGQKLEAVKRLGVKGVKG